MEIHEINTGFGKSKLLLGEKIQHLSKYLPGTRRVIITDRNVKQLYEPVFPPDNLVITIGTGEESKTMETLAYIFDQLISNECDRSCFITGIGGGIVCDIAGFAASVYMRGVRFGFVSTTLLSQVDASIGGKNGVNFKGYKNMVGVFNQPEFVLIDYFVLSTLPAHEYIAGYAEIIKHAAIYSEPLFSFLEKNIDKALHHDPEVIHRCVRDSLVIKQNVVQHDEHEEKGLRRVLNFGHTVGHAVEKLSGMIHGQAVAIGMAAAALISEKKGLLSYDESRRLIKLIEDFGLPVSCNLSKSELIEAMKRDKKRSNDVIHFVLLKNIGSFEMVPVPVNELNELLDDFCIPC